MECADVSSGPMLQDLAAPGLGCSFTSGLRALGFDSPGLGLRFFRIYFFGIGPETFKELGEFSRESSSGISCAWLRCCLHSLKGAWQLDEGLGIHMGSSLNWGPILGPQYSTAPL